MHGDACPDNVRLVGGDCRIFDFETSGWGPVRALARELDAELSSRWREAQVPDFPALARPGALLVQVPGWWRPER